MEIVDWGLFAWQLFWFAFAPAAGYWFGFSLIRNSYHNKMSNPFAGALFTCLMLVSVIGCVEQGWWWALAIAIVSATAGGIHGRRAALASGKQT